MLGEIEAGPGTKLTGLVRLGPTLAILAGTTLIGWLISFFYYSGGVKRLVVLIRLMH